MDTKTFLGSLNKKTFNCPSLETQTNEIFSLEFSFTNFYCYLVNNLIDVGLLGLIFLIFSFLLINLIIRSNKNNFLVRYFLNFLKNFFEYEVGDVNYFILILSAITSIFFFDSLWFLSDHLICYYNSFLG